MFSDYLALCMVVLENFITPLSTTQSSEGESPEPFKVNEASLRIVSGVKVMIKCHVTRRYNSTALNQRYESQT